MPNSFIRYAFLPIILSAFAAGCKANITEVLEDYKKESKLTYKDCGQALETCDGPGLTKVNEVQACLIDAFGSCKPAQARLDIFSTEGDPLTYVFFVAPDGKGGCKLDHFIDSTQDYYSHHTVERQECTTVSKGNCGALIPDGCTLIEEF